MLAFVNVMYVAIGVLSGATCVGLGGAAVASFRRAYLLHDPSYGLNGFVMFLAAMLLFLGSYLFTGMMKLP